MVKKIKTALRSENPLRQLLKFDNKHSKLLVSSGADPWVLYHDGWYYYCRVIDDWQISVSKAKKLENIKKSPRTVWKSPIVSHEAEIWAPELHFIRGRWYIYFTMGKAKEHRMYVLEATSYNPQGPYRLKGKINDSTDQWAIDGTVLELEDKFYFVWSGWEDDTGAQQNLYIASMSNPWTIDSERVRISAPRHQWEKATKPGLCTVNEGPEVLKHNGKVFIIYSASHSFTNDYCLGQLTLVGSDPLAKGAWVKNERPVFRKSKGVFGPGHASFTKGSDGSDWIIYHSARYSNAAWDRQVQAQKFDWRTDGSPNFGIPLPLRVQQVFMKLPNKKASAHLQKLKSRLSW